MVHNDDLKRNKKARQSYPLKLTEHQRASLIDCGKLGRRLLKKLQPSSTSAQAVSFTWIELNKLNGQLGQAAADARSPNKQRLLAVLAKVGKILAEENAEMSVGVHASLSGKQQVKEQALGSNTVYQFKITLLGLNPPIWRRIQLQECTLDKLHEHIQTAMGWTNSHLHEFNIHGNVYGDPQLLDDGYEDFKCIDSTKIPLSRILPKTGKRFAFEYEYDFGDKWTHEVLFEGMPPIDAKAMYPLCLEGERACPPEDCGGIWGYRAFWEAISDPEHEEHANMLEWCGGPFDFEAFDPKAATKRMTLGLPDWRSLT